MLRCVLQTVRATGGGDSVLPRSRSNIYHSTSLLLHHPRAITTSRPHGVLQTLITQTSWHSSSGVSEAQPHCMFDETVATPEDVSGVLQGHAPVHRSSSPRFPPEGPAKEVAESQTDRYLHSAIRTLIFSSEKPSTLAVPLITVQDIERYYLEFQSELSALDMSYLVRFLGTLSVVHSGDLPSSSYLHPRAYSMIGDASDVHWDFMERVVDDKYRLHHPLLSTDRYWLMRGLLAQFWEQVQTDPSRAEETLKKAERRYMSLRHIRGSHSDIHVPYFHALAASHTSNSLRRLVLHFRWILGRGDACNSTIVQTFMRAILQRNNIPAADKQALLTAVSQRVAGGPSARTDSAIPQCNETYEQGSYGIDTLAGALEHTLFGLPQTGESDLLYEISSWALAVTKRAFAVVDDASDAVDSVWNCLVLLALARTRSAQGFGQSTRASQDLLQHAAVVEWHTVCVLASIENLMRSGTSSEDHLSESAIQGLSQIVRSKWSEWTELHPSVVPPRSALVTRIICASFMRLAGYLKDRTLVDTCREFCIKAELWSVRGTQPGAGAGLETLASEQLYSSLVSGTFFERALVDLAVLTDNVEVLRGAVDTSVLRYAASDPEHAQELVAWATSRGIVPGGEAISAVGVALAQRGNSAFLDRYLTNDRISPVLRADVASAHLRMYIRYGRNFVEPAKVAESADTLFLLATQLPDSAAFLALLQSTMVALIRHQQACQVVELVEDIGDRHPALLSVTSFARLLRALLYHRQFRLAQRLLLHALPKHPEEAHRWTSLFLSKLCRVGARRLAARLEHRSRPTHPPSLNVDHPGPILPPAETGPESTRGSSPAPTVIAAGDPHTWRRSIDSLICAGQSSAATQFFNAIKEQAPPDVRTSLINTILHGILFMRHSSNNRRLRHLLARYEQLKEEDGFAPDHVTVNILVKGFLRSPADLSAPMTRQLFDALVRLGYPTGTPAPSPSSPPSSSPSPSPSHVETVPQDAQGQRASDIDLPPFGTKPTRVQRVHVGRLEIPRVDAPLRYERHVLPLYKMFIKAFYGRSDVAAARKVVGIIKTLELQGWGRPTRGSSTRTRTREGGG